MAGKLRTCAFDPFRLPPRDGSRSTSLRLLKARRRRYPYDAADALAPQNPPAGMLASITIDEFVAETL